jgi:hypothetical protein
MKQHRKILLVVGRGYHQEAVHHAIHIETFQYSIQNRKKVALTIQVFVGTKTGWFRGFCSYYANRGGMRERCIVEVKRKEDETAHENFFCDSFVYLPLHF